MSKMHSWAATRSSHDPANVRQRTANDNNGSSFPPICSGGGPHFGQCCAEAGDLAFGGRKGVRNLFRFLDLDPRRQWKRFLTRMALSAALVSARAWRDRRGAGILLISWPSQVILWR